MGGGRWPFSSLKGGSSELDAFAPLLEHVLDDAHEADGIDRLLHEAVRVVGLQTAEEFIAAIAEMGRKIGIPEKVDALQLEDYDTIIERAIAEADGYPVPYMMSEIDVRRVLNNLM